MPQAIIPVLGSIGIKGLAAAVAAHAITIAATYFVSGLLRGGPPKPDASEREVKSPKPARVIVLGERRVHGSTALPLTCDGRIDVASFTG
jgi:hypothetical protein